MLSIEEFKKTLPKDKVYTEAQIVKMRDDMDKLAGILFEWWLRKRNDKK